MTKQLPNVAIVGRPNVGKSSLFNRILRRRAAVVSDREGVTRDRHYQDTSWNGYSFTLIDTGGFLVDEEVDEMAASVRDQISTALEDAHLILFMIDGRVGVSTLDKMFASQILRSGKPVLLVANKLERPEDREETWELLQLGLGEPFVLSAATGYGTGDLLDALTNKLPKRIRPASAAESGLRTVRKFAVLGRPNAGKSTLVNSLLGSERSIVSDIPGTTRDSIDCAFRWQGNDYLMTDTAGLRKKARVKDDVEYFSNMRSLEAVRRADVAVLMVDATRGMEVQDFRIAQQIRQADKGLILVFNKWDIFENKDHRSYDLMRKELIRKDPLLAYVPILTISALEGQRIHRLLEIVDKVFAACRCILGRDKLAEVFSKAVLENPHPSRQTKTVRMDRACQILTNPPVVMVETSQPDLVDESWKRYLMRILFDNFPLEGAPLKLNFDRRLRLRKDEELAEYVQ